MPTVQFFLTETERKLIDSHRSLVAIFPKDDPRHEIVAAMHQQSASLLALNIQASMRLVRLQDQHPLPQNNEAKKE